MGLREQFNIELRGVGFVNKGAELMLLAIINKVSNEFPDARFVMEPRTDSPYEKRGALRLYQKLAFKKKNGKDYFGFLADFIPRSVRTSYGLISEDEIDIVIDASGFAYSDQFGARKTWIAAREFQRMKAKGSRIILLPQAFGPFTSDEIKGCFKKLIDSTDLVFTRDEISYKHVVEIAGDDQRIFKAPDFTNLLAGQFPDRMDHLRNRVCVIPNSKMVEKTKAQGQGYVEFVSACLRELVNCGETPFLLVHEADKDYQLVKDILKISGIELEVVYIDNPIEIKGIIGESKGVLSSRFHGLVSALSQGIPSLATGWSHKYQMLFDDYGFPEGCISIEISNKELSDNLKKLINPSDSELIRKSLITKSETQKELSTGMWEIVFNLIRNTLNENV